MEGGRRSFFFSSSSSMAMIDDDDGNCMGEKMVLNDDDFAAFWGKKHGQEEKLCRVRDSRNENQHKSPPHLNEKFEIVLTQALHSCET